MSHLPRAGPKAGFHSASVVLHVGANNQNHDPWTKKKKKNEQHEHSVVSAVLFHMTQPL